MTTNWILNGSELIETPAEMLGFCYLITNKISGKKYIGKKIFRTHKISVKTITQKNGIKKKKKTKIPIDSDWREYYGSSDSLKKDIELYGVDNFHREIIHLCKSKAEMTYWETYYQFKFHVLLRDDYYNSWLSARVRKDHLKGVTPDDEFNLQKP